MGQEHLRSKLQQALNDIVSEVVDIDGLDEPTQQLIRDGTAREASKKSQRIHEYLVEFVFTRFAVLESRIEDLEERVRVLGAAGPASTPTEL